jgi:hypothetical protein
LIARGLPVAAIAEWLGTSTDMVERHYNRYLTERDAHRLNGGALRWQQQIKELVATDAWDAADDEEGRAAY